MPRYEILAPTFIGGSLRAAGEIVEYDGEAGKTLRPLDNEHVDIPDDWEKLNGLQKIALARQLGAPKSRISAAMADDVIRDVLSKRPQKASAPPPPPPPAPAPAPTPIPTPAAPAEPKKEA